MPSCLGQDVVYFLPHGNAQHLTDLQVSVRFQRRLVFLSVVRMHYELGVEGEREKKDHSRKQLKSYKN